MGKQGVSKGLRAWGREGIYVATNSLRFAGVTYCLGHRVYSRRVYAHVHTHTGHTTTLLRCIHTQIHTRRQHALLYSVQQQQLQLCIRWIRQLFRSISSRAQCRRLIQWVLIPFRFVARKRADKRWPKTRGGCFLKNVSSMSKNLTVQSTLLFFFKYQNCIQVAKHGSRSVNLKNKDTIIYRFPASVFDQLFRYLLVLPYTGID